MSADWALAALAILAAGLVQASTGVGFGLIAAPALLWLAPALVPGGVIFLGTLVTFLAALREIARVNRRLLLAGLAGRLPGAVLGASVAASLSGPVFGLIFAGLILAALALSLVAPPVRPSVRNVGLAGFVSGLMGTITSVGAPPMALALQHAEGAEMRATISGFLLIGACLSMAALAAFGAFGPADIARSLALLPFALAGFWLSRFVIHRAWAARALRPAVLALCFAISLALLLRSSLALL